MSLASRSSRTLALGFVLLSANGCVIVHAQIPFAPHATAPIAVRREYYRRYHVEEVSQRVTPWSYGMFSPASTMRGRLGDGQWVIDPADLRPALRPNSRSMVALGRANDLNTSHSILTAAGLLLLGSSLFGYVPNVLPAGGGVSGPSYPWIFGTLAAANTVLYLNIFLFAQPVTRERERALLLFNESLRERLALCGDGSEMGDCANATNPTAVTRVDPPRITAVTLAPISVTVTTPSRSDGGPQDGQSDGATASTPPTHVPSAASTDASAIEQ